MAQATGTFTGDEDIISVPSEILCLKGNLYNPRVDQDWRDTPDKQMRMTCPPKPEPGILLVSGQRREGNGQERASTGADNRQTA